MTVMPTSPEPAAGASAIVIGVRGPVAVMEPAVPEVVQELLVDRRTFRPDGRGGLRRESVPAYLFDFDETIYGRRITIEFLHKLRDEARFPDVAALTQQMQRDAVEAREFFATHE